MLTPVLVGLLQLLEPLALCEVKLARPFALALLHVHTQVCSQLVALGCPLGLPTLQFGLIIRLPDQKARDLAP